MPTIQHILFPVDFSERCRAIRPAVMAMALKFHAKVTLLHVLQVPANYYSGMETSYVVPIDLDGLLDAAKEQLATFFDAPATAFPAGLQIVCESGDPAQFIVDYAAAKGVDLIMLPTHGYGRFRAFLLGSVAAKVLHDANCLVWTAAHAEDDGTAGNINYKTILCAVDLNTGSVELLRQSVDLAASFGAKLSLVHAVPGAVPSLHTIPDADFRHFLLEAAHEEAAKLQTSAGTSLDIRIVGGEVPKVISAAAAEQQADLVIIGRGKLDATLGRLRTHAYAIIRDSPCPVLSF